MSPQDRPKLQMRERPDVSMHERIWTHMNGAGNSFFIVDGRENPIPETSAERAAFAQRICVGTSGLSADGLFILEKADGFDFKWDFYNSDGSFAEMCGNASRCATRFFLDRVKTQDEVRFQTAAGLIVGRKIADQVYQVRMPEIPVAGSAHKLTVDGQAGDYYFVNTGVPHLVIPEVPVKARALSLRQAPELGAAGSNVTFIEKQSATKYKAVTFERGVDDYTLACGTGATAAAAYARAQNPQAKIFEIQMPGGLLQVEWASEQQAYLSGPAVIDYEVRLGE